MAQFQLYNADEFLYPADEGELGVGWLRNRGGEADHQL